MRIMRKLSVLLAIMIMASVFLSACGQKTEEKAEDKSAGEKIKVGFVYVGPVGDGGWTFAHDQGRKYLEEKMPNVETLFVESVPEGADAERVISELAEKGCKLIFTTSFGYMDPTINVAKKYPDVKFMHCSGYKSAENVGTYFGREYESRYLCGVTAAKMTKTNTVGYVCAYPIPEVVRGVNAFTLGAQSVNPKIKVKVVWTNTWYDPAKEKEAAMSLIDAGADIIAQHQDSPGPQQAAQERGVYCIGNDSDMRAYAPKANLTGPLFIWGPYYVKVTQSVIDGTWTNKPVWGSMAEGFTDIAPLADFIPQDVKDLVADKKKQVIDGKIVVFAGPIKDQTGAVKVPAGQTMTDEQLSSFDWFVSGVEGSIPKQ